MHHESDDKAVLINKEDIISDKKNLHQDSLLDESNNNSAKDPIQENDNNLVKKDDTPVADSADDNIEDIEINADNVEADNNDISLVEPITDTADIHDDKDNKQDNSTINITPTTQQLPVLVHDNIVPSKKTINKKRKKIILLSTLIPLTIIIIVASFIFYFNQKYERVLNTDTFYDGIYINDIHVGGLSKNQAVVLINDKHEKNEAKIIVTVRWEYETHFFTSKDVDITYDTQSIIETAFDMARQGTNKDRYKQLRQFEKENIKLYTTRTIDLGPIEYDVRQIALSKDQSAQESAVIFNPDTSLPTEEWFEYTDSVIGIETNDQALWEDVVKEFENETYGIVEVQHWEILPSEDIDLKEITKEITSFTSTQSKNSNREFNIALACAAINGTVLMPDEVFSMNDTTGERTVAKGYREANTIVGGNELIPGIAGGVCQVSGTLYNAAFRANLEIVERSHHSFELGYLSRGRDATVDYGSYDLQFKNNTEYPIYISMYTKGLTVYAKIFGAPLSDCDYIDMYVKTTKTTPIGDPIYVKDSSLTAGSEPKYIDGRKGIVCEVYKVFLDEDGKEMSKEYAYKDVYRYYPPELRVNPDDYEGYVNPTPTPDETNRSSFFNRS